MEQVKIILLMLYVSGYTSLIWANAMFDWIKVEGVAIGVILFIFFTIVNLPIVAYLTKNWYK